MYYGELSYQSIDQVKAYPLDKFFSEYNNFVNLIKMQVNVGFLSRLIVLLYSIGQNAEDLSKVYQYILFPITDVLWGFTL